MKVIRKRLDDIQTRPPFTRWSDVCECVEITFDFGVTWVESPENDPREGVGFRAPALTGGDAKCDAAARMVAVIEQQVEAALTAATAVGIATAIIGIVTVLVPGINILVNLFVAIAGALVTIGAAAIDEAFTPEVYDGLTCIFYDNIDENGQVSSAQIVDIQNDVNAQYPGVVFEVFALLVLGMGSNGFSNAGALGTATGDCSDCDEFWCCEWDSSLTGWEQFPGSAQGSLSTFLRRAFDTVTLTFAEFEWTWNGLGNGGSAGVGLWAGYTTGSTRLINGNDLSGLSTTWTGSQSVDGLLLGVNGDTGSSAVLTITRIKLKGIEPKPSQFPEDNCEP